VRSGPTVTLYTYNEQSDGDRNKQRDKERKKERKKEMDLYVLTGIFVSRDIEFDPSKTLGFKFQMHSKTKGVLSL
jgi:hypothetical protein